MNAQNRMTYKERSRKGFTLLETMIGLAITTILVGGVIAVFMIVQRAMAETAELSKVNNQARNFSDWVTRDLREGAGLISATEVLSDPPEGTIVIRVPPIDAQGHVLEHYTDYDYIAYYSEQTAQGSTVLVRLVLPSSSSYREDRQITFGNSVSGNSFAGTFATKPDVLGAFVVHYQFTDEREVRGKKVRMRISGSVRLRNKEQTVNPNP